MADDPRITQARERHQKAESLSDHHALLPERCRCGDLWPCEVAEVSAVLAEREQEIARLREVIRPIAEQQHYASLASHPLFSVELWRHNAGEAWPKEPDDDSYTAFENCKHPLCAAARDGQETPRP